MTAGLRAGENERVKICTCGIDCCGVAGGACSYNDDVFHDNEILNAQDYVFNKDVGKLFYCYILYLFGGRAAGFYPCFFALKMAIPPRGRRLQL